MHALLLLGLITTADATKDAANIEGTWVVVSVLNNGKDDDDTRGHRLIFKDGTVTHMSKQTEGKGTYKLNSSAQPPAMDVQEEGKEKPFLAIYKIEGDKLLLCMMRNADSKRPTEFTGKEGSGQMLIELKREKK